MKNREVFRRDPVESTILNDGVAAVREPSTASEYATLRYELENFVCEGQYGDGLIRILESYLGRVDSTTQPAAWVSGFYGSGKSHLLKMLRHLWVNTQLPDGSRARELAQLPSEAEDLFRELDTLGRRFGDLHATSGALPSGADRSLKLAILSMLFRSKGFPAAYPQARFCMWLDDNGYLDKVREHVAGAGRDFYRELSSLYVSPVLAEAVLEVIPSFAPSIDQVLGQLEAQFRDVEDLSIEDFVHVAREVLEEDGQLPCTLLALDEIQLYIGGVPDRSLEVQDVAEALCKQFDSRLLLIGAGQTALAADDPLLQRLSGRFTITVELSDTDVETVTRQVVLAKKASKRSPIEESLQAHAGEIHRQLNGTKIAARQEDEDHLVDDYPLLPSRRRFWAHALRAVDAPGTASQLRTQLRIVHEAVRQTAEEPLGTVVPGDFIFGQIQPTLVQSNVLLREVDDTIRELNDGSEEGVLAQRLCGLIFLIRKLPREEVADIGVRATPEMLADLLVSNLSEDGSDLRRKIPPVLDRLVNEGTLIKIDEEYSLQTRESAEWEREFRNRQAQLRGDLSDLSVRRRDLIRDACSKLVGKTTVPHGSSKVARKLLLHYGSEPPASEGTAIPVWIRDGWGERERSIVNDARAAGSESATVFVFIPKSRADDLERAIVDHMAAQATLDIKGVPTSPGGREAREAMETRRSEAKTSRDNIIRDVVEAAKVYQGGGSDRHELTFPARVESAARDSLDRMFPSFHDGDAARWDRVISRARGGDEAALSEVGWTDAPQKHPVCAAILDHIGAGKQGKQVRSRFATSPYGWPQDAVDAALIALHTTGHLKAVHRGVELDPGDLDQTKLGITDFRTEGPSPNPRDRIRIRKIFQDVGVRCGAHEEVRSKVPDFLRCMQEAAESAGGDPPLPKRPRTEEIDELKSLTGNEQLAKILEGQDELLEQFEQWRALSELAEERLPGWKTLWALLDYADQIPEGEDLKEQAEAVRVERRLLESTNPVPDILKPTAQALRQGLRAAYEEYQEAHCEGMEELTSSHVWQHISEEQRTEIIRAQGLTEASEPDVSSDAMLLESFRSTSISDWKTHIDALPKRFDAAAQAAARLLEPTTQQVRLKSEMLKTEEDIRDWLEQTERDLVDRIKDGPIVIS